MSRGINMTDLLFIEFGAVVTKVLGRTKCKVEPWCDPAKKPSYDALDGALDRVEVDVDFAHALTCASVPKDGSSLPVVPPALRAWFDPGSANQEYQVHPVHGFGKPLGPSFPGGVYEGIVSILEEDVKANEPLAKAVAGFPGHRWEYQVVVSVDKATGVA